MTLMDWDYASSNNLNFLKSKVGNSNRFAAVSWPLKGFETIFSCM